MPLGWECVAVCEIDKSASAVLSTRFPNVPNLGDFTKIGVEDVGTIDLLVGGTPCQDFSVAGLRVGIEGERGNLTLEFIRLADRLKPKYIVWENVPGILSLDEGKTIQKVIDMFTQIGYICDIDVHDAQEFGVPQRRRRVFVTCVRLEDLLKKKTSISDRIILELLAQAWQSTWDASLPALCHVKSRLVSESRIEERAAFLQKKMDLLNTLLGASAVTRLLDYWGDPQVLFTEEHPILELTSLQSREQPTVDLKMDTGGLPNKEATKECGYKNTAVLWQNVLDAISGIQNQSTTSTLTAETMETVISSFAEALLTTLLSIVNSPTHFFQENWSSDYWNLASLLLTLTKGVTAYAGSASCELFSSHSVRDSWGHCVQLSQSITDILERHIGNWTSSREILFIAEGLQRYPPPRREAGKGVAGCLKGGSGERGWPDPSDGNGGGLVDVAGTLGGGSGERGWQHHDGAGAFIPEWPAEIASTLDSHFGDKQGLEDQHINSGASHFVPADKPIYATDGQGNAAFAEDQALALNATHEQPYVVGTMACNTGPKGHDAGNFQSNQGVDSGYVIPVEQPMCIKGAAIGRKPEAGPQYGEVLTDGSSYTLNASETHGVLAFAQNTREEVRIIGEDGDVSGSLSAETGTHQSTYLAFTGTARQGWAPPSCPISIDCALPLDTKREQAIVMLNLQGSKGNSVAQEDGPSFTLNSMHGHDVHAIAYKPVGFIHPRQLRGIETSNQVGIKTEADISDALTGEGPGAVSFHTSGYGGQVDENVSQTLQASDARLSNQVAGVIQQMQVRRLTPIECERLQGIPDNWTKITEKSADGPRYRMIGNSFAVPVVAWIGKRIQMVEELIESI